jgi:hypothetical protein
MMTLFPKVCQSDTFCGDGLCMSVLLGEGSHLLTRLFITVLMAFCMQRLDRCFDGILPEGNVFILNIFGKHNLSTILVG